MTTDREGEPGCGIDSAARLYDIAIDLALERLEVVDAKEKKDNVAFDRVARTAQTLVRLAADIDALIARKRKESRANDKSGDVADREEQFARDVAVIKRDIDEHIDRRAREGLARDGGGAVPEDDSGGGDGA